MNRLLSISRPVIALVLSAQLALGLTVKPNVAPVVTAAMPAYDQYELTTRAIDLNAFFKDPDASAAVQLTTVLGTMNLTLDGETAPITVANFLRYVDEGRYFTTDKKTNQQASLFFHRAVTGFVIQSGGFMGTVDPNAPADNPGQIQPTSVATFVEPVQNEPVISNTRGTIAMAKTSQPNSATSQWFINLANNTGLDDPNVPSNTGGFTVFGRVAQGMTVADAIVALPRYNGGGVFAELPVRNYSGNKVPKVQNLVSIPGIGRISPLNFSASSDNPGVAEVRISGINLLVDAKTLGSAQITVTATDLDGASVSQSFTVNVTTAPGRLRNISTRANFPQGNEVLIPGFIIRGGTSKRLAVRAIGPTLTNFGIANPIDNPRVELVADNTVIASNDNWNDSPDRQLLIDLGLAPGSDSEAALIATVPSNPDVNTNYTAVVRSNGDDTGVGVVEVYDLDSGAGSTILNLSTRGEVGTGGNALFGGFLLRGADSRRLAIRAVGPTLAKFGVPGTLPDPTLEVRNAQGVLIDSNNDWQTHPAAAEMQQQGVAPEDPKEPAVIVTLPAGDFSAVVTGVGPQPTGAASVEIYQVQQ